MYRIDALRPLRRSVVFWTAFVATACGSRVLPDALEPAAKEDGKPAAPPQPVNPAPLCELTGEPVVLASDQTSPRLLALDAEHVVWTTKSSPPNAVVTETIWRVPKRGGAPAAVVRDVRYLASIATYEGHLYWSAFESSTGRIFRLARGSAAPVELVTTNSRPQSLAANRDSVYWADGAAGALMKVNIDGTGKVPVASGQRGPQNTALDDTHVYWMNSEGAKMPAYAVMKAPLAGGETQRIAGDQSYAHGIAVDATYVFVTTVNQLLRVGKDGAGLRLLASNDIVTGAPAVDATRVYWVSNAGTAQGARVMSTPKDASSPAAVAAGLTSPAVVAADAAGLYWLTGGDAQYGFKNGALTLLCR